MPFPDAIAELYQQHPNVNPDTERAEFKEFLPDWQLYLDLLEMDRARLVKMVESHGPNESPEKLALRKKLAVCFNLVPMLVSMYKGYILGEEPRIDVKGDPDLQAFLDDADGVGTNYVQYVGDSVLPLLLAMGFQDVLIQNPAVIGDLISQQEATKIKAKAFAISPTKRINWSTQSNGEYNWICFKDKGSENFNPLARNTTSAESYITLSAKLPDDVMPGVDTGFWTRQWPATTLEMSAAGQMAAPDGEFLPPTTETDAAMTGRFWCEAGFTTTARVPVATVYYKKSNDPDRRHFGVSKIAVIAVLTKKAIQVLSWSDEDVLANLAILAIPTGKGQPPRPPTEQDTDRASRRRKPADSGTNDGTQVGLSSHSIIFFPQDGKHAPLVVQGDVDHIRVKVEIVSAYMMEILRLCNMMWGAHAKAERVNSGVQAVVQRNELFQDLRDVAGNLDRFTFDVLALVKSWATGKEVSVSDLKDKGVTIDFYKGPYTADSIADVISNATAVIEEFRIVSPAMCESAWKDIARAYLYSGDPALEKVMEEIEKNSASAIQSQSADELLAEAAAIAAGKSTSTATITEATPPKDNAAGEQKPKTPAGVT